MLTDTDLPSLSAGIDSSTACTWQPALNISGCAEGCKTTANIHAGMVVRRALAVDV